jgi:RND family efflux transporter MFP subunit
MISQSVAEVQTQYNFAKSIYEKQKNLWDQQIGSEVQYLTAKNNWESLGKRLAAVREQLDMTRIKSPVDGTVDNVQIKIGQAVMPGMPAFQVVNFTGLKVKGEVGEAYVGKINKGDEVVVYFPDLQREINTTVDFAAQTINTLNRTFNVETSITGSLEGISPNMIAVMKIVDYKVDSAIVLPVDVLQRSGEGYYAMVAVNEGGKLLAHRKMVTTGKIYNGRAEILTGISETDQVIITGYRDLNDGQELRTK